MNDFAVISLSDLMVPLEQIMKRVECAAEGDFVICLYNPKKPEKEGLSRKGGGPYPEISETGDPGGHRAAGRTGKQFLGADRLKKI